jgi:hypothetical protein
MSMGVLCASVYLCCVAAQLSVYLSKMFRCLVLVTYVQVQWSISLGWDFIYQVVILYCEYVYRYVSVMEVM